MTDVEWLLIADMLPATARLGRRHECAVREIVYAIFHGLRGGLTWRSLPKDFPLWQTVYRWFSLLRDGCVFERVNCALAMADRQRAGHKASSSAAIIDSQSVKTTESSGPRGHDAGKTIKGRKRHALVDSDGRALQRGIFRESPLPASCCLEASDNPGSTHELPPASADPGSRRKFSLPSPLLYNAPKDRLIPAQRNDLPSLKACAIEVDV